MKRNLFLMTVALCFMLVLFPAAVSAAVTATGNGVTPAGNTTVDGIETFTFPFSSDTGDLTELELDFYFGANTGADRNYTGSVGINLPAGDTALNGVIDGVNSLFKNAASENDLITAFGGGDKGEAALKLYEAAGFRAGEDMTATVENNIQYNGSSTAGTWTLKLNTYLLDTDTMEILAAVKNANGDKWGENNYTIADGANTQAFLYSLTEDNTAPALTGVTVTFSDNTTATGINTLYCTLGKTVKSIKVTMTEAVSVIDNAVVTMKGTAGDCATKIPAYVEYGTITPDPSDNTNKTLIITADSGNGTAGYAGEMTFKVDAGVVSDLAENTNGVTGFSLVVGKAFDDVTKDDWYFPAVTAISATGITVGVTEHSFAPDQTITRAQFLVMLMRSCNIDAEKSWTDNFSDAGSDEYYSGYLAAAKKLGIAQGIGDNKFVPNQNISRQEMFTLLYRILDKTNRLIDVASPNDLSGFVDSDSIADFALTAIRTLVSLDVVHGDDNHMLFPAATATRAQAAQIIFNALDMINAQG